MKRIPDLRAQDGGVPSAKPEGSPSIAELAFTAVMVALLALVAVAPGLSKPSGTNGFWAMQSDAGYTAAVQRLVRDDLLEVRELPPIPGQPPRRLVKLNEAAFAASVRSGAFGQCGTASSPLAACKERFDAFSKATFLRGDMQRADPAIWDLDGRRLVGIRANAHRLRESGYRWEAPENSILYARGTPPSGTWSFVDTFTHEAHAVTGGIGACASADLVPTRALRCARNLILVRSLAGTRISRNGRPVSPADIVALQDGDVLAIARGGYSRSYQLLRRPTAPSMVAQNGQRVRAPGLAPLLEQVDTSADGAISGTIRRDLQEIAQRHLNAALDPARRANRVISFRGALLLMDGMTGEIAAAATYPLERRQLSAQDQALSNHLAWLRQNQNFERLRIGSAAKVPFAAVIANAYPDLLKMRTEGGSHCMRWPVFYRTGQAARGMAGCPNAQKLQDHAGEVGFVPFIVRSNNFHAVSLLRHAWRADPSPASRWQTDLIALTCASDDTDRPTPGCPIYPWASASDPDRGLPLSGLRLAFDAARIPHDSKSGLFDSIIGGGNFSWTTVQLAQAYARLLTGRDVRPRLTAATDPAAHDSRLSLARSWDMVAQALRNVITENGGTAHQDWGDLGQLAPGITVFGKTGTPLVNPGLSDEPDGKTFVLAAARTPSGAVPTSPEDICGLRLAVVNIQYGKPTGVTLIARLIGPLQGGKPSPVRQWLTAPCTGSRS